MYHRLTGFPQVTKWILTLQHVYMLWIRYYVLMFLCFSTCRLVRIMHIWRWSLLVMTHMYRLLWLMYSVTHLSVPTLSMLVKSHSINRYLYTFLWVVISLVQTCTLCVSLLCNFSFIFTFHYFYFSFYLARNWNFVDKKFYSLFCCKLSSLVNVIFDSMYFFCF